MAAANWEKADNTGDTYRATYILQRKQGSGQVRQNVRVITNVKTGAVDVYTTAVGTPDKLIYSYSAAQDKVIISNQGIYDQMFTGSLENQLNNTNKSTKIATLEIAKITETDKGENLKKLAGYKSLANVETTTNSDGTTGATPASGGPAPAAPAPAYTADEPEKLDSFNAGLLKYPIDIRGDQDRITFQAVEIAKSSILSSSQSDLSFAKATENNDVKYSPVAGGPVILPIQAQINDENTVNWSGDELDAIKFAAVNQFGGFANPRNDFGTELSGKVTEIQDQLKKNSSEIVTYLAQEAVSTKNLLSRTQGKILNPNLELLFNGPQLRSFSFTFKLSPRSEKEAVNVKSIIRYFKQNSAVRAGKEKLFLSSPYAFKIIYQSGSGEHKSINRIKVCALKSMNVNYTPLGTYMTYEDEAKTMVSYQMTLQFQEIIPILQEDYAQLAQDEIGY